MSETTSKARESEQKFYKLLDSIAKTKDPVKQNKQIKQAEFAEDSREPTAEETAAIRRELAEEKEDAIQHQASVKKTYDNATQRD